MKKLQKEKDEERSQLFSKMSSAEKQTDVLISELITSESRYSDPQKVDYLSSYSGGGISLVGELVSRKGSSSKGLINLKGGGINLKGGGGNQPQGGGINLKGGVNLKGGRINLNRGGFKLKGGGINLNGLESTSKGDEITLRG